MFAINMNGRSENSILESGNVGQPATLHASCSLQGDDMKTIATILATALTIAIAVPSLASAETIVVKRHHHHDWHPHHHEKVIIKHRH